MDRPERWSRRNGTSLFWHVFMPNALVLALAVSLLAVSLLAFTPASISSEFSLAQAVILFAALVAIVLVNLVLIRRAVSPLEELTRVMADIDPLRPGQRVTVGSVAESAKLADVFNSMIERLEIERRESGRRMLSAQEQERIRLARELHDEIGQSVTALMLELDHAARRAPPSIAPALRDVQEARALSDEIRLVVRDLRPEVLDDLGLHSALVALTERFSEHARLTIRRHLPAQIPDLHPDAELVIYRVAQEGLTNAARHAEASSIDVALEPTAEGVRLTVTDDGRGLNGAEPGSGVQGMLERAMLIGARVEFTTGSEGGTELCLDVPVPTKT